MSKKTIEERLALLKEQESNIKLQLTKESDEIRGKANRIGKIALTVGVVAILGYWIFNAFMPEDEEVEKKKKKKNSKSTWERLANLAAPYLNKFLDGILNSPNEKLSEEKDKIK